MRMRDLSVLQILVHSHDTHLQAQIILIFTVFLLKVYLSFLALPFLRFYQDRYRPVPLRMNQIRKKSEAGNEVLNDEELNDEELEMKC